MSWTRDVLVARVRHVAMAEDATGDWPDDVVLDHASLVHRAEWGHLLGMNARLRMARRVVVVGPEGVIDRAQLSTPTEHLARVVRLVDGAVPLFDLTASGLLARSEDVVWSRMGDVLVVDRPVGMTLTALVTHTPPLVRDLPLPTQPASGAVVEPLVEFPDGWEMLLAYETAAHLLDRGARESDAAVRLEQKAEAIRQRMLAELGRDRTGPLTVAHIDDPTEWGGC